MEVVSHCTGKAWRARISTNDPLTRPRIDALLADASLPEATWTEHKGWHLEAPHDHATLDDPLIAVTFHAAGAVMRADARLEDRCTLLSNETSLSPASADWPCADLVRLATPDETLELALRWTLLWGHLGCAHPDELAFWGRRTTATALVVDAPDEWLAHGAPLPHALGTSAFIAYCGNQSLYAVSQAIDRVSDRHPEATVGGGVFPTGSKRAYALIAVAHISTGI